MLLYVPGLTHLRMMRIGFDAKRLFNNLTGLGNYSRTLLTNLGKYHSGNEYFLYSPYFKDSRIYKAYSDSPYKPVKPSFPNPLWRGWHVGRQIKRDGLCIYHGLSHQLPVGLSASVKKVVTIHDLIFKIYPETFSAVDRWIYHRKFSYAIENADVIIAISKQTRRDILKYFPHVDEKKIHVIYQPCHEIFYRSWNAHQADELTKGLDLPPAFFLSVSSITPRKNLKRLIEACSLLSVEDRLPLVVVGNGRTRNVAELIRLARQLNVRLIRRRAENNRVLKALYMRATTVVYVSLYEGFGLPVAEALLSGTPVVTSNLSSLPEAAGPGILVDPHSTESVAAGLKHSLLENKRSEIKLTGLDYALNQFDPKKCTDRYHRIYEQLS